jgi:ubiquinone biosynthesis UbiH/UbiF/VisC/COQ6 family hydroxylase
MRVMIATRFTAGSSSRFLVGKNSGGLFSRCMMMQPPQPRTTRLSADVASFFSTSTTDHDTETTTTTDVLIVGGGVVGCALARQLTSLIPGIRVDLVEAGKGHAHAAQHAAADATSNDDATIIIPPPHARSYALSPASLETLGWNKDNHPPPTTTTTCGGNTTAKNRIGYYDSMQIWEAHQPSFLLFTSHDLKATESSSESSRNNHRYLGACVEDRYILEHLWNEIQDKCRCIHTQSTVSNLEVPQHSSRGLVKVQLSSTAAGETSSKTTSRTKEIRTHLLVAADGGNSSIRRMLNVPLAHQQKYGQVALTFTVELEESHNGRAFQRFLAPSPGSTGGGAEPLALLPTFSDEHATIVWSTSPENVEYWKGNPRLLHHVNDLLQQGPQLFEHYGSRYGYDQLHPKNDRTGGDSILANLHYGAEKFIEALQYGPALMAAQESNLPFTAPPRLITSKPPPPVHQQFSFPLSTGHVSTYGDEHGRFALIGDAAHTMHPMAGQGLNLGLQDVADLVRSIQKATDAGMDVHTFLSSHYNVNRTVQVALTLAGIHALHGMYGMQHLAAKHVKSLGMNAIQNVGLLRRQLAQAACHGVAVPFQK